jgi:hypothetical protein
LFYAKVTGYDKENDQLKHTRHTKHTRLQKESRNKYKYVRVKVTLEHAAKVQRGRGVITLLFV